MSKELALKAPDATLIDYHRYPQAIPFYTHRRVLVAGFGALHSPDFSRYFLYTDQVLLDYWTKDPSAVLIIDEADLRRLVGKLGPARVIASQGHMRAVTKLTSSSEPREPA